MKKHKILSVILLSGFFCSASLPSCQQAKLEEEQVENAEQKAGGRNGQAEQNDSTGTVTPKFDTEDWEGSIDAEFEFGGEEQN